MSQLIITLIIFSLFPLSLMAQSSSNQYLIEAGIDLPEPGDIVCQAYLGNYSWRGIRWTSEKPFITNLPKSYCRYGRNVGELEVVAIGDFYLYKVELNDPNLQPELNDHKEEVCNAKVNIQGSPYQQNLRQLPIEYCSEGNEILLLGKDDTISYGIVSVVGDYYYPRSNTKNPYYDLMTKEGVLERIIKANYNTSIEL